MLSAPRMIRSLARPVISRDSRRRRAGEVAGIDPARLDPVVGFAAASVSHVGGRPQMRRASSSSAITSKVRRRRRPPPASPGSRRPAPGCARSCGSSTGFGVVELRADVGQVAADDVADRLARLRLRRPQRRRPCGAMSAPLGRATPPSDAVVERADQQRHDAERPLPSYRYCRKHHLQLDRVLRQVGQPLVVEQPVAVVRRRAGRCSPGRSATTPSGVSKCLRVSVKRCRL